MSKVSDEQVETAYLALHGAVGRDSVRAALEAVSSIHEAEPVAWMIDPGAGSAMDRGSLQEPLAFQYAEYIGRGGSVTPLYAHPAPISKGVTATHRHKKRGSEYVLIGVGKMQATNWLAETRQESGTLQREMADMAEVAIYRSVDDGSLWVRPIEEFNDGRFEALSHTAGEIEP